MAQRVRFTKEVIELFEALAPDTEEVLAEIGQMSDAELEQELAPVKEELDVFLKRVREKFQKKNYPPISPGTLVETTEPNLALRKEWNEYGWSCKKWGVRGTVITHHDSHGLGYDVKHEDGSRASYDPTELKVV